MKCKYAAQAAKAFDEMNKAAHENPDDDEGIDPNGTAVQSDADAESEKELEATGEKDREQAAGNEEMAAPMWKKEESG